MQSEAEVELEAAEFDALLAVELQLREEEARERFVEADYFHRWGDFVRDCFVWPEGEGPYPYQPKILDTLERDHRVALRGPRGATKTTQAAWAVIVFAVTREVAARVAKAQGKPVRKWKIGTTAGSNRQLEKYLWPEIAKWVERLRWDLIGLEPFTKQELVTKKLTLDHGFAYGGTSKDPDLMEGLHEDEVLFIFDEAKAIAEAIFDACEGSFRGKTNAFVFALSTPGDPTGRFYDIFARKRGFLHWTPIAITLRECVAAGQITLKDIKEALRGFGGKKSRLFETQLLGQFPTGSTDSLIPLAWIEAANDRWLEWRDTVIEAGCEGLTPAQLVAEGLLEPMDALGSDVCTGGRDSALLAPRHGWIIPEIEIGPSDPTRLGYRMISILKTRPGSVAIVDSQTVGAGVPTLIEDEGIECIAFNGGKSTKMRDISGHLEFADSRSAMYWYLRDCLDPANNLPIALPVFERDRLSLTGDLAAPYWWHVGGGKIKIESKNTGSKEAGGGLRKRLGRSTDAGDTVAQAFWPGEPQEGPGKWFVLSASNLYQGQAED